MHAPVSGVGCGRIEARSDVPGRHPRLADADDVAGRRRVASPGGVADVIAAADATIDADAEDGAVDVGAAVRCASSARAGRGRPGERMRAVVQRVSSASVVVKGNVVGAIDVGFVVLVCAVAGDTVDDERWLLEKVLALRVFADAAGKMSLGLSDMHAAGRAPGLLVVSQFTLAAELSPGRSKGNRPSFTAAMDADDARAAVDRFIAGARGALPWLRVETGVFGADMDVSLVNDGPVTLWLDSRPGPSASTARGG